MFFHDPKIFSWNFGLEEFWFALVSGLATGFIFALLAKMPKEGLIGWVSAAILGLGSIGTFLLSPFLIRFAYNLGLRETTFFYIVLSSVVVLSLFLTPRVYFRTASYLFQGLLDLATVSLRRIYALSYLSAIEAMRKRVFYVMFVFAILFLFASWFLTDPTKDPDRLMNVFVSFTITSISWLVLPMMFMLSCWSLPDDIKSRSLHTLVTKPARRSEILLGRIIGIGFVGTVFVVGMSCISYVWLIRALPPEVTNTRLKARVPQYATDLYFQDNQGIDAGKNTGDIFSFRAFIQGNSSDRAVFIYDNPKPNSEGNLELRSTFQVFRTIKGDIDSGISCELRFVNSTNGISAPVPDSFKVMEYRENIHTVQRKLLDSNRNEVDIFNDLVDNGKLRIEVACLTGAQYIGMARPDLYILKDEIPFIYSYAKSCLGIWMMMMLLIITGVTASTFLKGPIAMQATLMFLLIGMLQANLLSELTDASKFGGGGPLESIYRLYTHLAPTVPLQSDATTRAIDAIDLPIKKLMVTIKNSAPDLTVFNLSKYTAHGFDVPNNADLARGVATLFGYAIPMILLAYFALQHRELESK